MSRGCSICTHPSRQAIDAALASRVSMRSISGLYQVSRPALGRHRAHVHQMLAIAIEVRHQASIEQATDILVQMENYETAAVKLFNDALARKDEVAAAAWYDRALKATNARLVIETARPPKDKTTNSVVMRMQKQEVLASLAGRFGELLLANAQSTPAATTIEHDDDNAGSAP